MRRAPRNSLSTPGADSTQHGGNAHPQLRPSSSVRSESKRASALGDWQPSTNASSPMHSLPFSMSGETNNVRGGLSTAGASQFTHLGETLDFPQWRLSSAAAAADQPEHTGHEWVLALTDMMSVPGSAKKAASVRVGCMGGSLSISSPQVPSVERGGPRSQKECIPPFSPLRNANVVAPASMTAASGIGSDAGAGNPRSLAGTVSVMNSSALMPVGSSVQYAQPSPSQPGGGSGLAPAAPASGGHSQGSSVYVVQYMPVNQSYHPHPQPRPQSFYIEYGHHSNGSDGSAQDLVRLPPHLCSPGVYYKTQSGQQQQRQPGPALMQVRMAPAQVCNESLIGRPLASLTTAAHDEIRRDSSAMNQPPAASVPTPTETVTVSINGSPIERKYDIEPYSSSTMATRHVGPLEHVLCAMHNKRRSAQNMILLENKETKEITWRCKATSCCKAQRPDNEENPHDQSGSLNAGGSSGDDSSPRTAAEADFTSLPAPASYGYDFSSGSSPLVANATLAPAASDSSASVGQGGSPWPSPPAGATTAAIDGSGRNRGEDALNPRAFLQGQVPVYVSSIPPMVGPVQVNQASAAYPQHAYEQAQHYQQQVQYQYQQQQQRGMLLGQKVESVAGSPYRACTAQPQMTSVYATAPYSILSFVSENQDGGQVFTGAQPSSSSAVLAYMLRPAPVPCAPHDQQQQSQLESYSR